MLKSHLRIIYTSDVHGQLISSDYATGKSGLFGLSRLKTFLNQQKDEYILIDNGDMLQGSVLLDYDRKEKFQTHPAAKILNHLKYQYVNIGNHDFNYGYDYLKKYQKALNAKMICANIFDQHNQPIFEPYVIHETKSKLKIGIISLVTSYIPMWEKKEHIENLHFKSATDVARKWVKALRHQVDYLIVLYHGGFEKNPLTHEAIGRPTQENEGYALMQLEGVDLLLTGHQHVSQAYQFDTIGILQTGYMARDFGVVDLDFIKDNETWKLKDTKLNILPMNMEIDDDTEHLVQALENKTQLWLEETIGITIGDWKAKDPLSMRIKKHPLMQLINQLQLEVSQADVSCASLPNDAFGFEKTIKLRDLAANFIYPNTLVKLKVNGRMIKEALERTAEYYSFMDGKVGVDPSFLYPKCEHYNVDIYDGLDYVIDPKLPKGHRVTSIIYQNQPLKEDIELYLILNNYRAIGGGDYFMFKEAVVIEEYDMTLFDLVKNYLYTRKKLDVKIKENYLIIGS
jgi:2',3'-cyclic-nucleotide 2'-phosphodiesterase/3'-nucleotidase